VREEERERRRAKEAERRDGGMEEGREEERERMECRILRCGCALDYSWTTQSGLTMLMAGVELV